MWRALVLRCDEVSLEESGAGPAPHVLRLAAEEGTFSYFDAQLSAKRHGTITLFTALNVRDGQLIAHHNANPQAFYLDQECARDILQEGLRANSACSRLSQKATNTSDFR